MRLLLVALVLAPLAGCAGADLAPGARPPGGGAPGRATAAPNGNRFVGALSNGAPVCSDGLAADAFGFGLCLCGDAAFAGDLSVHGLDAQTPASAAANGDWSRAGVSVIEGDLVVGARMSGAGDDDIEGDLDVGAGFAQAGVVDVGGDARIGGDAVGAGVVGIDGTLTVPEGARVLGIQAGGVVRGDVDVPPPCDCGGDASTHVDVQGFIAQARSENDDAAAGIDPAGFESAGAVALDLPAGRYFVEDIAHAGVIEIHASGAVELFVAGDVASAGDVDVDLDDGATLDLFIGGDLAAAGVLHLGDGATPDAVRLYVDGSRGVALAGDEVVSGALYLPHGTLASAGDLRVAGAVVARDLAAAGVIDIGFAGGLVAGDPGACTPATGADPPAGDGSGGGAEIPPQG